MTDTQPTPHYELQAANIRLQIQNGYMRALLEKIAQFPEDNDTLKHYVENSNVLYVKTLSDFVLQARQLMDELLIMKE